MSKIKEMLIKMYDFVDEIENKGYEKLADDLDNCIDEIIIAYNTNNNIIKQIEQWQKDRLLDKQKYIYSNEFVNILEELMESIGIKITKDKRILIMQDFIEFIFKIENKYSLDKVVPTEEDEIDSWFDIIVFSIGSIMKLGYEPECVLQEGIKHINSRTGKIIDGKFQKDLNIKTYEPEYNKCKVNK